MVEPSVQFSPAMQKRIKDILVDQQREDGFDLVPGRYRRVNHDVNVEDERATMRQLQALRSAHLKYDKQDAIDRHNDFVKSYRNLHSKGSGFLVREETMDDHPLEKKRRGGLAPYGSSRKLKGGKKSVGKNPWIAFFKQYKMDHPEMSPKMAMKKAGEEYRRQKKGGIMIGGKAKARVKFRKSGTPKRAKVSGTSREIRKLLEDLF